jgi:hypothetical protein
MFSFRVKDDPPTNATPKMEMILNLMMEHALHLVKKVKHLEQQQCPNWCRACEAPHLEDGCCELLKKARMRKCVKL